MRLGQGDETTGGRAAGLGVALRVGWGCCLLLQMLHALQPRSKMVAGGGLVVQPQAAASAGPKGVLLFPLSLSLARTWLMEAEPSGSSKSIHSNSVSSGAPSSLSITSLAFPAGRGGTCRLGGQQRMRGATRATARLVVQQRQLTANAAPARMPGTSTGPV